MFGAREEVLTKIIWDGESNVEFVSENGGNWCGAKRKDFWHPDSNWEERIKSGSKIRLWTVQYSRVLGFELWENNKWISVWCLANDFRTKEEREKSDTNDRRW